MNEPNLDCRASATHGFSLALWQHACWLLIFFSLGIPRLHPPIHIHLPIAHTASVAIAGSAKLQSRESRRADGCVAWYCSVSGSGRLVSVCMPLGEEHVRPHRQAFPLARTRSA